MTLEGKSQETTRVAAETSPADTATSPGSSRRGSIRVRIVSWLSAGVVLFGFWSLGRVASMANEVFKGFGSLRFLPALTQFSMGHGTVLFPIFGVLGAIGIILAERVGRRQRFQALLFAAFVAGWILLLRSLFISGVWMSSLDQ